MKILAFAVIILLECIMGIPAALGVCWLIVYCLKPAIWFLVSSMTLSIITRLDGWYAWYGYWDLLPWFTWNEILIATIISGMLSYALETVCSSTIFKPLPPKTDKSTE